MSRTTFRHGEQSKIAWELPLKLPPELRFNPVLFTTITSDQLLHSMVFTFYPNAQGASNLVRAIRQRCGVVVKYCDLTELNRKYAVTLINTAYLVQSTATKMLLPYDSFDMSFVIDMILKDGKDVNLNEYRLSPTKYEAHSANDILRKIISWSELVRLKSPPRPNFWSKETMKVNRNLEKRTEEDPSESRGLENQEIDQPSQNCQKLVAAADNKSPPGILSANNSPSNVLRTKKVVSFSPNPQNASTCVNNQRLEKPESSNSKPTTTESPISPVTSPGTSGYRRKVVRSTTRAVPAKNVRAKSPDLFDDSDDDDLPISQPNSRQRRPTQKPKVHRLHSKEIKNVMSHPKRVIRRPGGTGVIFMTADPSSSDDSGDEREISSRQDSTEAHSIVKAGPSIPTTPGGERSARGSETSLIREVEVSKHPRLAASRQDSTEAHSIVKAGPSIPKTSDREISSLSSETSLIREVEVSKHPRLAAAAPTAGVSGNPPVNLNSTDVARPQVDDEEDDDSISVNLSLGWISSATDNPGRSRNCRNQTKDSRTEYSHAECQRILNLVLKYDLSEFVVGNNLWKLLIKLNLLHKDDPPRTFSSLQTMFRRKIMPDLKKSRGRGMYRCSPKDLDKFLEGRSAAVEHKRGTISEYDLKQRIAAVDKMDRRLRRSGRLQSTK